MIIKVLFVTIMQWCFYFLSISILIIAIYPHIFYRTLFRKLYKPNFNTCTKERKQGAVYRKANSIFLLAKMHKLKPLLPTLKEKKRYVVYKVNSEKKIGTDVSKKILEHVNSCLGLFESAEAGVQPILYEVDKQKGVLRVNTKFVDRLKVSLALMNEIEDEDVMVETIGVSGILKKAKERFVAG